MDYGRSQKIIEGIVGFATGPDFVYTHEWREGHVPFWDNRSSMHRATPFNEGAYRRRMHRTTLKGDRPFHTRAQNAT